MDRNQAYAEFRQLHERAKSGELGEADLKRWKELKHLLIVLEQPKDSDASEVLAASSEGHGNA